MAGVEQEEDGSWAGVQHIAGEGHSVRFGLRCRCLPRTGCLHSHDAPHCLHKARGDGYEFVMVDGMFTRQHYEAILAGEDTDRVTGQVSWCDKQMQFTNDWNQGVSAVLKDVTSELSSSSSELSRRAARILQEEVDTAAHLNLQSVILQLTEGTDVVQLARVLETALSKTRLSLWVQLPIAFPHEIVVGEGGAGDNSGDKLSAWMLWHKFRSLCNFDGRVNLLLEVTKTFVATDSQILLRWLGEPIAAVLLPQDCFLPGAAAGGIDVLSDNHEFILHLLLTATCNLIFDPLDSSNGSAMASLNFYSQKFFNAGGDADAYRCRGTVYRAGYEDFLQNPLQPLQDNLEAPTYEVFEKDRIKYSLYEEAIHDALVDLVPEEEKEERKVVLMVLGAGRGPIVDCAICAMNCSGRKVKIYAVDKNRRAANTLFFKNRMEWDDQVTVVNVDMRDFNPEDKADIIVSELLGSFGDNELSPECLDGAQKLLKQGGVMIPQSYTSFLAPIMSPKMFQANIRFDPKIHSSKHTFDVPYVVNLYQRYQIAPPQELFTFCHPRPDPMKPNDRFGKLTFKPKLDCMLNGFVGYFDCKLYKDVRMSILPSTFSRGMFSWFPMFFPIRAPIMVRQKDEIEVCFWRHVSKKSVWYEWELSSPQFLAAHNANGRAYTIGLN